MHYEDQFNQPIWEKMWDAGVALAREMGAQGLADDIPPFVRHETGTTWHDAGTMFMGDLPDESVTDVNGHFHHIANAVCVDQSLFPTVGSANPVLTGLCLSRKVAETIGKRYTSEPELSASQIAQEKTDGFEFLLEGGNAAKWRPNNPRFTDGGKNPPIANNTIIELQSPGDLGVLSYDDPALFGNFELRLQWKAFFEPGQDITANSGIFLRAPAPPSELNDANFYNQAIEVQIDDTGYDSDKKRFRSALHRTGAIYKIASARVRVQKIPATENTPGFWNSYRIVANGTEVSVELNGVPVSSGTVRASLTNPGRIALQYHTGKVQFRSVRIKRLP